MQHYPRAQAWWERLAWWRARRCAVCGMPWLCDEATKARMRKRSQVVRNDHTGAWASVQTQAFPQVGRAGWLTPAQTHRAGGPPC
ncbi:hypothetical protein KRM28CT15_67340 [Krasilnikovia sp. M28-CT-15]